MEKNITGKKVAILITDGFEESEFTKPFDVLKEAGAHPEVVSIKSGKVKAWNKGEWGKLVTVDKTISNVNPDQYDALVLPGGVMSPDKLRMNAEAVDFVSGFLKGGKPVAAICHGPWTLIETGLLKGKTVTSYPSIKTDLINAGANWIDQEVVVDQGLVTSRTPDDLSAFCKKMVEEIAEGVHVGRRA